MAMMRLLSICVSVVLLHFSSAALAQETERETGILPETGLAGDRGPETERETGIHTEPGLTEDRGVIPERGQESGEREGIGLENQVGIGTVEDESVLPGEEEGTLRGAGVGLTENEGVAPGPEAGAEGEEAGLGEGLLSGEE